jgi:hypothetical protein
MVEGHHLDFNVWNLLLALQQEGTDAKVPPPFSRYLGAWNTTDPDARIPTVHVLSGRAAIAVATAPGDADVIAYAEELASTEAVREARAAVERFRSTADPDPAVLARLEALLSTLEGTPVSAIAVVRGDP